VRSRRTHPPGQPLCLQRATDVVAARVHQLSDALSDAQHEKHGRVDAHGDAGIATLDPGQGGPADHRSLGHNDHGQPSSPAGRGDVLSKLAQGSHGGGRQSWQGTRFFTMTEIMALEGVSVRYLTHKVLDVEIRP
jgi:hypothetical protein